MRLSTQHCAVTQTHHQPLHVVPDVELEVGEVLPGDVVPRHVGVDGLHTVRHQPERYGVPALLVYCTVLYCTVLYCTITILYSLRDRALPRHTPEHGGVTDISVNMSATFTEERPYKDSYYYLLVVSSNTVSFHFSMDYKECGKAGLYGREQKDWMMTESGLKYNISQSEAKSSDTERQHSFQLFSVDVKLPEEVEKNFDLPDTERLTEEKERQSKDQVSCRSTFDFTRIDLAEEFSTNFILQSRSFYTKWLTVFNRFPIITRFKTLDHSDLGGTVNIILGMEEIENTHGQTVEIYGCLERGREPVVRNNTMECSEDSQIKVILV